jgi:hypothetical protein
VKKEKKGRKKRKKKKKGQKKEAGELPDSLHMAHNELNNGLGRGRREVFCVSLKKREKKQKKKKAKKPARPSPLQAQSLGLRTTHQRSRQFLP